jgi:hypothetical protein
MGIMTSTGVRIFVSSQLPASQSLSAYEALTWQEVNDVTTVPAYGPQTQVVTHEPLSTGVTQKFGGFTNFGSVAIEAAYNYVSTGQALLRVNGLQPNQQIAVRISYADSDDYTQGKCFSGTKAPGSANSMVSASFLIEFNKPVINSLDDFGDGFLDEFGFLFATSELFNSGELFA